MTKLRLLQRRVGRAVWALIACAVMVSGAPGSPGQTSGAVGAQTTPAVLVDIQSTAELRTQFNDDHGNARLILLLSPT
jgi:hypothetical protein